jgi:MFS family permease
MIKISYSGYRFPPEIIQHAIWLYIRFTLSFRDLRKRRPKPHTTWHLDEVYLKIDGRMVYLWRAVDAEGEVLDVFGLCVMLFHLANAALLPLVGQRLAAAYPKEATAMMSACIVAAQAVMLPIAVLVGRTADSWGRKPLFLAGFAILPIRAILYTLSDNSFWLVGVQVLDGVGAGIFGALTPLVIADIMRGTGRYNLAQGAIATVQGIGASLSGLAAGEIVDHFGYSAAFLTLGAAALVALVVFALGMPETADWETVSLHS